MTTPHHLDYLQRLGDGSAPDEALARERSFTSAPESLRRLWRVDGVGQDSKDHAPPPAAAEPRVYLPTEEMLTGLFGHGMPLAFAIRGTPGEVALYLGTWSSGGDSDQVLDYRQELVKSALASLYPFIRLRPAKEPFAGLEVAGLVRGIPTIRRPDALDGAHALDRLIRGMSGANWGCLVLAEPADETLPARQRATVIEELRAVHQAAQHGQAPAPLAKHYSDLLQALLAALTAGLAVGTWRTGVYLLGDRTSYARLAALWRGLFSGDDSVPDPVRVFRDPRVGEWAAAWALPNTVAPAGPGHYQHCWQAQTLLTSTQLAGYVHLPRLETAGFAVTRVPRFDAVPPDVPESRALDIGPILHQGREAARRYAIGHDQLARHVLVAGVTGSGKTNTIFRLLDQVQAAGLPFLVVEPAKTEYRSLLNHPSFGDRVQVFTLGDERVSPLRLNPFEVMPGVPVGVHVDLLRSVFSASFGMWTPLPQVLEQCLHAIYTDRGWDLPSDHNARLTAESDRGLAFPTLSDLAAKVDEVTKTLGYDERVTADIRAALLTRINGLRAGAKGCMLDVERSVPIDVLLDNPTVLELEGMGDDDDKAFVMGLILIRLAEYRRASGAVPGRGIQHVLVVEEAHRLLSNPGPPGSKEEAQPRAKAVETFANLLAEVRAYGQGVIISDQVPVKLAPDAIKNTNLKIAHRVVAADDRTTLAGSMAMDDRQALALSFLRVGQAAVFGPDDDAPVLLAVPLVLDELRQGAVDAERLRAHMTASPVLAPHRSLLLPLPAYPDIGAEDGAALAAAKRISEETACQRTFSRLALSAVEDPRAIDRLWPEIIALARAGRPPGVAEGRLLHCLVTLGSEWLARRRGAQAAWSFSDTAALASGLRGVLLDKLNNRGPSVRRELQALFRALHARRLDPFPACSRICRQQPPVCLYRYAAADFVSSGRYRADWSAAGAADAQTRRRHQTLEVCMNAGEELIEFAGATLPREETAEADAAARRASLCFGQQILFVEGGGLARRVDHAVDSLIEEAHHEGPT